MSDLPTPGDISQLRERQDKRAVGRSEHMSLCNGPDCLCFNEGRLQERATIAERVEERRALANKLMQEANSTTTADAWEGVCIELGILLSELRPRSPEGNENEHKLPSVRDLLDADPTLTPESARAIEEMYRLAYERLAASSPEGEKR